MSDPVRYFVGLDLGQVSDYTALAVLERPRLTPQTPRHLRRPAYSLRHLRRFPLGTPYTEIVPAVRSLLRTPPLPGCLLAVDRTGVGRAVVDMLADGLRGQAKCQFVPITITAGQSASETPDRGLNVPKKELAGVLQVLLQARRLLIARTLPEAPTLLRELQDFRVKVTAAGNETFESWREGQHDDLVLAVAMAAWAGEKALQVPDAGGAVRLRLVTPR